MRVPGVIIFTTSRDIILECLLVTSISNLSSNCSAIAILWPDFIIREIYV